MDQQTVVYLFNELLIYATTRMTLKCLKASNRSQNQQAAFISHSGEAKPIKTENIVARHRLGW